MLVSDLIKFRDDYVAKIAQINQDQSFIDMTKILNSISTENTIKSIQKVDEQITNALVQFEDIYHRINSIRNPLAPLVNDINQSIDNLAANILVKKDDEPFKYYHKINFTVNNTVDQNVKSRIQYRGDWHFPGLQLGCRNSNYTSELVANDPLYLCDFDMRYINNATIQFNEIYNRRLRKYTIVNHDLNLLPQNQFGFVLSWMLFNYAEFSVLSRYLEQIIKLLRPGGIFMFSYNNGDIFSSCQLSESGGMSWIPKRHIIELANKLGYEIIESFDLPNNEEVAYISWIELKKPGHLSTIKRSQAQGLIMQK